MSYPTPSDRGGRLAERRVDVWMTFCPTRRRASRRSRRPSRGRIGGALQRARSAWPATWPCRRTVRSAGDEVVASFCWGVSNTTLDARGRPCRRRRGSSGGSRCARRIAGRPPCGFALRVWRELAVARVARAVGGLQARRSCRRRSRSQRLAGVLDGAPIGDSRQTRTAGSWEPIVAGRSAGVAEASSRTDCRVVRSRPCSRGRGAWRDRWRSGSGRTCSARACRGGE